MGILDDIVNREMQIYPLVRDVCNWKYESSIKDNMEYHQLFLSPYLLGQNMY